MQHACFTCRKCFKRIQEAAPSNRFMTSEQQSEAIGETWARNEAMEHKCPNCGGKAFKMGIDFKAPKKTDAKAWAEVAKYIRTGNVYYRGNNEVST